MLELKRIYFVTEWIDNASISDQNVEVLVELIDGCTYALTIATPENIRYLTAQEKMNYSGPGLPPIIVNEFTVDTIEEAIKAYAEDGGYWLKLYQFAGDIKDTMFDELQTELLELQTELPESSSDEESSNS